MPSTAFRRGFRAVTMTAICALTGAAAAQDMPPTPAAATPPPANPAPANPVPQPGPPQQDAAASAQATAPIPGPAKPAANPLSKAQLDQLVAPIALYPDPLLSQVLMASTYPLEVVEAARWVRDPANQALKGDPLTQALKQQNWDPSVMALVPFPKLLALMADKLQWTEALGNAFLAQQADVMNAVHELRHQAMEAGNINVTPQCNCVIQTSGDVISILPSDTNVVCIPLYNPRVAYGAWRWADYPPDYFPVPVGFYFEPGYEIGFWPVVELAAFGPLWGWGGFDWVHHDITVDRAGFAALASGRVAFSGSTWAHDPAHRGGVGYSDAAVNARFGAARTAAITAAGRAGAARAGMTSARVAASGRFGASTSGRFGAAATTGHVAGHVGGTTAASFARGSAFHSAGHAAAAFHGPVGRGPAPVRGGGGGHIAHAQFSGGGPHFGGGGPHGGGGGAPHGGGGGGGHHH